MIRLTVETPWGREVHEGADAKAVGEQIIAKHGPTKSAVPWEDKMDDGWTFPRFVIAEELRDWAAEAAGVGTNQILIEDI
jgi:hypothetical protein